MKTTTFIRPDFRRLVLLGSTLLLAAAIFVSGSVRSQPLYADDLEELVAPIALYPDDVLGIVLPASTFPLDIVRAARFLDELEEDPALQPDEAWDESVIALLNYPAILLMMNEDLDWTWALGEAVLTDESAVLDATQAFRRRAYVAGNLRSDDKQVVANSTGVIEIRPTDPKVVYIPAYEPREVVVYQPTPIYRYYPVSYPVYYYPYPSGYSFASNFFWGVTSYFSIGWHSNFLHVHHHSHRRHPYYLNSYYAYTPYYSRNNVIVTTYVDNHTNIWRPSARRGNRPRTVTVERHSSGARTTRTATVESQPGTVRTRTGRNSGSGSLTRTTTTGKRSASAPKLSGPLTATASSPTRGARPSGSTVARTRQPTRTATPPAATARSSGRSSGSRATTSSQRSTRSAQATRTPTRSSIGSIGSNRRAAPSSPAPRSSQAPRSSRSSGSASRSQGSTRSRSPAASSSSASRARQPR